LPENPNRFAHRCRTFSRLERAVVTRTAEQISVVVLEVALEAGGIILRVGANSIELVQDTALERCITLRGELPR
jgi:hypothetical protein